MAVTVSETFLRADGQPDTGSVSLRPLVAAGHSAPDRVVTDATCQVQLVGGEFTASVVASDDPAWDLDPETLAGGGMPYRVEVRTGGMARSWLAYIPGPGPHRLRDLVALDGPPDVALSTPLLDARYVELADLVPLPLQVSDKHRQEAVTVRLGGLDWITLGADPVAGSVRLFRAGLKLPISTYTVVGREITVTGLTAGDVVEVVYTYPGSQTAVAASTPAILVSDAFTRADSASSLGSAPVGGPWSPTGTWGISGNQAYLASPNGGVLNEAAVFDVGVADVIVQVKLATIDVAGGPGLQTRESDVDNAFTTNSGGLYKREAAANLQLIAFSTGFASGDTIRVRWIGDNVTVYRQAASAGAFAAVGAATNVFQHGATKHGVRSRTVNTGRLDDFVIATAS